MKRSTKTNGADLGSWSRGLAVLIAALSAGGCVGAPESVEPIDDESERVGEESSAFTGQDTMLARSRFVSAIVNAHGELEVHAVRWEMAQRKRRAANGVWSDWETVGPDGWEVVPAVAPALARRRDGALEVFASGRRFGKFGIYHRSQAAPGSQWTGWALLDHHLGGGPGAVVDWFAPFTVGRNGDGRLELFAGFGNVLWHNWENQNGSWSGWDPLYNDNGPQGSTYHDFRDVTGPVVANMANGRIEVFARPFYGENGNDRNPVHHIWQTGGGNWSGFDSMGGSYLGISTENGLSVGANADGRLQTFMLGEDEKIWTNWQTNGGWSGERPLDASRSMRSVPAVGRHRDGRMLMFAVDKNDRTVQHLWQHSPNSSWSGWGSLGAPCFITTGVVVAPDASGAIHIFVGDAGPGDLWTRRQRFNATGGWLGWSDWEKIGTNIRFGLAGV